LQAKKKKQSMSCTAFFFDLNDGALREMPPVGNLQDATQLPESLALKVHNRAIPTRDELDANLAKANKNREKFLNKKVEKAKIVDERVAKAKQLKREMDENMTLLGNTVHHNQRAIPTSPTLPQRLQERLQTLEAKSPPMTADMIRQRESRAESNRARILQQRCEKARTVGGQPVFATNNENEEDCSSRQYSPMNANGSPSSFMTTPKKQDKEPPVAPFSPAAPIALPQHLVERLESMPSPRTTKQLLDRCSNASRTREGLLRLKTEKARRYLDRVELTRIQRVNNMPSPELPSRLASRLEQVTKVHTLEQLMAKEARAVIHRAEMLAARVAAAKEHADHAAQVVVVATERHAKQAELQQLWSARPEYTTPTLPSNLQAKLDGYLAKRQRPTAILDHNSAVALRHASNLSEKVDKAKRHSETVELRRMNRGNIAKPAKLTAHLVAVLATRSVAKAPAEILARCDTAKLTRDAIIKQRVEKLVFARTRREATIKRRQAAQKVTQEERKVAAEDMQQAKVYKTAEFVPAKLRARLVEASKCRPTPQSILDHESNVVANRAASVHAKVQRAREHNAKVEEVARQTQEMKQWNSQVTKALPTKFQRRMQELDCKRATPKATLERERKAIERRGLLMSAIKQREVDRNTKKALVEQAQQMHEQLHKPEGSPLLPAKLKSRLKACAHPTAFELLEKESNATLTRLANLQAIQDKAKAHSTTVEYRRMCKHNSRAATVSPENDKSIESANMPEHLAARLKEMTVQHGDTAEKVNRRMESATRNRAVTLAARVGGLHMHNSLVQQRYVTKLGNKTTGQPEEMKPTTTA
jgi:hypothetical protein